MSRAWGLVPQDKSYENFLTQKINVSGARSTGRQSAFLETVTDSLNLNNTMTQKAGSGATPYTVVWPPEPALDTTDVLGVAAITEDPVTNQPLLELDWVPGGGSGPGNTPSQFVAVSSAFSVAIPGKQYPNLTDAVAYITAQSPSPTNRWTIQMFPGTYVEPDTVTIPSWVTLTGDFGLSVVIKTSGTSHILQASTRCDIYNIVIQGPTEPNKAGLFADDSDIGFFLGGIRFVGCDIGLLLQPAATKTVFAYVRNCLFNGNVSNQILVDGDGGNPVNAFFWNNVIYAPSGSDPTPGAYGPLMAVRGTAATIQGYSNDFEREATLVAGVAVEISNGAAYNSSGATYNWFDTAISVLADHTSSSLYLNGPRYLDCNTNLNMANSETVGYISGANDFAKTQVVYPTAFYINNSLPTTITVGTTGASDFTDLVAAVAYVISQTPTGAKRFVIQVSAGNYFIDQTLYIPDFCDLVGESFTQTSITVTTAATDSIHAGYESRISNLTLYGYGTDPNNPNFATPLGNTGGYGILYAGSSSFSRVGYIENVQFGNLYYGIGVITGAGLYNVIQLQTVRFRGYVNTKTCIQIDAGSGGATAVGLRNSRFSPTFVNLLPGLFESFLSMTADAPEVINNTTADTINIIAGGTDTGLPSGNPLKYGTGFQVAQGQFTVQNTRIAQMDTAFHVPTGATPVIAISSTTVTTCVRGLFVESSTATGSFQGIMDRLLVESVSPLLGLLLTEPDGNGSVIVGGIYQTPTSLIEQGTTNVPTNLSPQLNQGGSVGTVTGGVLTVASGNVTTTAGSGYVMVGTPPNDVLYLVEFKTQSAALTSDENNYVYVDVNGALLVSTSAPNPLNFIFLGTVVMDGGTVALYVDQTTDSLGSEYNIRHLASNINTALQTQFGAIVVSGLIFTNPSGLQLAMTQGQYYVGAVNVTPSAVAAGSNFLGLYSGSGPIQGTWASVSLTAVPLQWNNAGTLTALTGGQYAKHALYVTGESANQKLFLVYGSETFASSNDADAGALPLAPGFFSANVVLCAAVVVDNTAIDHILDQRPTLVSRSGAIVATNNHSNLTNLGADDHLQYFRTDGTRLMTGNINTNNNNIIVGTGTVDGVVVHAHASRHVPGGADPLPTAAAVTISALTNAEGIAGTFARSDHLHAHGAQTNPTLHAVATGVANGFMSAADKTFLDAATSLDSVSTLVERSNTGTFQCRGVSLFDALGAAGVTLGVPTGTVPYTLVFPGTDGSSDQVLLTDGTGVTSWSSVTPSIFTGVLPIAKGGTNSAVALNNNRIMVSSAGGIVETSAALTNGQVLIGVTAAGPTGANLTAGTGISITNGPGSIAVANTGVTSITAGTGLTGGTISTTGTIALATPVAVANGGTNSASALNNNRIMGSSGGAIVERAAMANGQLIIGNTGNTPSTATLTAGTGISITNGAGSISIARNTDRVFAYDTTTQNVSVINTFQDILFSTNAILSGWTHTAGTANFVCATTGDYEVTLEASGNETKGAPDLIEMLAVNNGVQVPGSQIISTLQNNNAVHNISGCFLVSMVATQILKFQLTGGNTTVQLLSGTGNATIKPSISVTIIPVT